MTCIIILSVFRSCIFKPPFNTCSTVVFIAVLLPGRNRILMCNISFTRLAFLILPRFIRLWAGPCGGLYSDTSRCVVVLHSHSNLFLHCQSGGLFDSRKRRITDWECRRPRQSDRNKIWNNWRWQHDGLFQGQ